MLHWSNGACRTKTWGVRRGWLLWEDQSVTVWVGLSKIPRDVQATSPQSNSAVHRERAPIPACPRRSVPLKMRSEVFLSARLLCEGDVALTLPEMTKPKGLSSAADPYGGVFINFIQCLYEHWVCIIFLHHCISDLEGCQNSWAQTR